MAKARILLVDGNALTRAFLEQTLAQMNYEVAGSAETAEDAVRHAETLHPDLVLMDTQLRGELDGFWAAVQIHNQSDIPIILMTTTPEETLLQQAKGACPQAYLVKPVGEKELLVSVEMTLYKHRTEKRMRHLMQVLRAQREVNQLITREHNPLTLLEQACQVLMGTRGYSLVWIGQKADDYPQRLIPVAQVGRTQFLRNAQFTLDENGDNGGLVNRAFQSGQPVVCNDLFNDHSITWRGDALRSGLTSAASIPMIHEDRTYGVISVYAPLPNAFDEEEINLLHELACDLAYALKGIEEEVVHKNAQQALRESEDRYRQIVNTATEGIWMLDENLITFFANQRIAEILGYTQSELVGKALIEFIFPEDIENFLVKIAARKSGSFERYERRLRCKDGQPVWVIVSANPMMDSNRQFQGIFTMLTDITHQKEVKAQLKNRLIDLEVVYENGLALGQLLEPKEICNKVVEILSKKLNLHHAVVRLLNTENDTVEVMAFHHEMAGPNEQELVFNRLKQAVIRPGQGVSGWVIANGETVSVGDVSQDDRYTPAYPSVKSGIYVPIKVGDYTIGCITVESDKLFAFDQYDERLLTTVAAQASIAIENARLFQAAQQELEERKRVEEALRLLNEQLEQRVVERIEELSLMNASLERAARLKDEFLASMSHELRTPLTGVLNLSEALQEQVYGVLNEKQLHLLHTIELSGRHLLGLINDILDLSKIEAGLLELQIERVSAGEICQSSLQMIKGLAQKKRQTVSFTIIPAIIETQIDGRRIKQALVNLLSNAVKFTPEGGKIGLHVVCDETENMVRFTISDTGVGISAQDMPKLFHPFTQLDSSLSRSQSGTGLGLALVKRMIDLHQGSISVQSTPGEGSQFTISLPWSSQTQLDNTPQKGRGTGPLNGMVQDVIPDMGHLMRHLEGQGVSCFINQGVEGSVEMALQCRPDMILVDSDILDMDAYDFHNQIMADPGLQRLRVITVSPVAPILLPDTAGLGRHLFKPLTYSDVDQEIDLLAYELGKPVARVMAVGPLCSGPLILLADDNEINLQTYADYLRIKGYRVVTACNGPEALELFQRNHPDLTLMDIQMPGMDGLSVIQSIRALENDRTRKPIIALTALAMTGDRERCLKAGADDYLSKPISLQDLIATIQSFIQAARKAG